ncbi:MAG TPA: MBL fold metallo-hydrolase [Symbiobacteriaceae bacterium]|nr:MBL fold metallo-hydrolase [Symbiobacteriaceae bacterium]
MKQISLPTPWPAVGPIHTYLIKKDPITLIDTGVNTPESREALEDGLRQHGLSVKDIRRVLLTHAHVDHMGLAAWVQEESGAEVWLHPDEAGKAENPPWWVESRDESLIQAGVPRANIDLMDQYWRVTRGLALPLAGGWCPITPGQRFAYDGGALEAVHLPGHALGHTGFLEAASGTLIGGDHLLTGVSPNPIMEPVQPGHPAAAPHAPGRALTLGQFLGALEQAALLTLTRVLPAHGPVIDDHRKVTDNYRARHERRLGRLTERLARPATVWEVTREIYPHVEAINIFLAVSEVLAHLDLLVVRGEAAVEPAAKGWQYRTQ